MRCLLCGRALLDGQPVLEVGRVIAAEGRGAYVLNPGDSYVHLDHLAAVA